MTVFSDCLICHDNSIRQKKSLHHLGLPLGYLQIVTSMMNMKFQSQQLQSAQHAPCCSARTRPACARRHQRFACHSSQQGATTAVVTDVAIPEGHKGLHQALYGEGSEEAHSAAQYALRQVCD